MMQVTDGDFKKEVLDSELPVIVDFWAEWCGPCKLMGPVFEELSKEYEGKVKFVKLDVDSNQDTASKYGVMSIPTLILFKDGKEANKIIGFAPKPVLKQKVAQIIQQAS